MPPSKTAKFRDALKNSSKGQQILYVLALVALISVFLPWVVVPYLGKHGAVNGYNSVGFLTFLGSLGYLLWKLLPTVGVKIPNLGQPDMTIQKILAGLMLAGPVIWIFQSGFSVSVVGNGLWLALVSSGLFCYLTFQRK